MPAPSEGWDRHPPQKRPRFSKTLSIFRVYPAAYHRVSWRVLVHYRGERPSFSILDRRNGEVARHCHRAVMSVSPGSIVHADAVSDVSLVLRGYTVSRHRRCLSLIAGNYVMRDSLHHCIRLPIDTVDPGTLATAWADFSDSAKWSDPLYAGPQAGRQGMVSRHVSASTGATRRHEYRCRLASDRLAAGRALSSFRGQIAGGLSR